MVFMINWQLIQDFIDKEWQDNIIQSLSEYIKIPNKSPSFDENWQNNGYMEQAVEHIANWCRTHATKNMKLEILRLPSRTPLILIDIPGNIEKMVLLYGHLDKQPEMEGWADNLSPWHPVLKNGRLYGRGGADDGYAVFSAITAIRALQEQNLPHGHCIILIEACEESGSYDLPYYFEKIKDQIGTPDLVIGLDSGAGNYDQLWLTTSLRGVMTIELTISLLTEGIHSGYGSGIVADSFLVLRDLLSRIENEKTGEMIIPELYCQIPETRVKQAVDCSQILGNEIYSSLPLQEKVIPITNNLTELILNRTWRPSLTIIGADGIPSLIDGGNVLRPYTSLKLSLRLPPLVHYNEAMTALEKVLIQNPPYNAKISFKLEHAANGWHSPILHSWLEDAVNKASLQFYKRPAAYQGEGGSIPFIGMLGEQFKEAQFVITGVLGPHSNAHGPNEFLDIEMAKKLTACVSYIVYQHGQQN